MRISFIDIIFDLFIDFKNYLVSLDIEIQISLLVLSFLFVILLAFLYTLLKRNKQKKTYLNILSKLTSNIQNFKGVDSYIDAFMSVLSELISAQTYAFYVSKHDNVYYLKILRDAAADSGYISPSYDGLAPYRGKIYAPPQKIKVDSFPSCIEIQMEGNVPLLSVPAPYSNTLFRIGPVSKVNRKTRILLEKMVEVYDAFLKLSLELQDSEGKYKKIKITQTGTKNITNIISNYRGIISNILNTALSTVHAKGGVFILFKENSVEMVAYFGIDSKTAGLIEKDINLHKDFNDLIHEDDIVVLSEKQLAVMNVPDYLNAIGFKNAFLTKSYSDIGHGIMFLWNNEKFDIKEYRLTALLIISRIIGNMINNHLRFKQIYGTSIDMLKSLSQVIDNLRPYTVGRSKFTSRFAMILGNEMGLEKSKLYDLALAAHLSNIGIIGISEDIILKKGRYLKSEYELMKLHCEIGASIVEVTTGNTEIAKYIRQHHERVDGNGYPLGLEGEDISLQARIIAVVQTFLAKINGREDREPLAFEEAISLLKSASGTQLDSKIVDALIKWFDKKQKDALNSHRSLGKCWEMMCIPLEICRNCPCYNDEERNCWEHDKNNCKEHGDNCNSCYVHTEYMYRKTLSK